MGGEKIFKYGSRVTAGKEEREMGFKRSENEALRVLNHNAASGWIAGVRLSLRHRQRVAELKVNS